MQCESLVRKLPMGPEEREGSRTLSDNASRRDDYHSAFSFLVIFLSIIFTGIWAFPGARAGGPISRLNSRIDGAAALLSRRAEFIVAETRQRQMEIRGIPE
jgi:hypothetical protein